MSKYDKGQYSGIGTDLFIKKNSPGQHIGEGYTIELFLNGVKQEDIQKRTKKEVIEFIKEQKGKYNTDRAFENASQFHITYKTKEERGELPNTGEESHMSSIDTILLKQASALENLMQRLMSPSTPIKIRKAADDILNTNEMPDPAPGMSSMPVTPESVAKMLTDKVVAYVNSKENLQVDELYNDIKHWIKEIKDKLNAYSAETGENIDRKQILSIFRKDMFEGGLDIAPEKQKIIQDVLSKKASVSTNDSYTKLSDAIENTDKNNDTVNNTQLIRETITNMDPDTAKQEIDALHSKTKNFSETFADKVVSDMEKDLKLAAIYCNYMQKEKKAFFTHVASLKGTRTLDSVFNNYIKNINLTIDDTKYLWGKVQEDITGADKFASIFNDMLSFILPIQTSTKKAFLHIDDLETDSVNTIFNENPNILSLAKIWNASQSGDLTTQAKAEQTTKEILNAIYPQLFDTFEHLTINKGYTTDPAVYQEWLKSNLENSSALSAMLKTKLRIYITSQIPDMDAAKFVDSVVDKAAIEQARDNSYGWSQLSTVI